MKRKKTYEAPKVEQIVLLNKQSLLAGSGEQLQNYRDGGDIWNDDSYDE